MMLDRIMLRKCLSATVLSLVVSTAAFSQSRSFKMGQWMEIHNAILKELDRSYVDTLPIDRMQQSAIDEMLKQLDPYTIYVPEDETENFQMMIAKTYGGIGAVIYKPEQDGDVIINEPYANTPSVKGGIESGDRIIEIDGESVHGMTADQASSKMKGKPGTIVKFKIKKVRTGEIKDVVITRERIHLPDVEYSAMIDDTTGYILQSGFTENVSAGIRTAFNNLKSQGMKKLVLDLRGNGGGLMNEAINIVSLFVPKGSTVVSQKGKLASEEIVYKTHIDPLDTEMPIVVLVDGGSASSSEIVSGALQDLDRATIMGSRTFGKGLVQSVRPLPYYGQLKVTTAKYYTPSGRCVQAIDYATMNEDGSVAHIPDSLTHEFKTLHGRTVRDGGGITPDVTLKSNSYSRITYSLVLNGIIDQYVCTEYVSKHAAIPQVDDFHLTDAEFDDFVEYAKTKKFDYRSNAKALYDQMKKELEKDGLSEEIKDELAVLDKTLSLDKEKFIRMKKDELIPFIEEEIVKRYYFQEAAVKLRLRYDDQLKEALTKPLIAKF